MLLFVVAVFLAVALDPVVVWLDAHRIRRGVAAPLIALGLAAVLVGFLYVGGQSLVEQGQMLGGRIAELEQAVADRIPQPLLSMLPTSADGGFQIGTYMAAVGQALVNGLLSLAVALILTIYLLLDGRRTYAWLVAFAPHHQRARVHATGLEARKAILAYVRGNVITSIFAAVFVFVSLEALHVPATLLLALLAGICDFLPVLGFILSATPAVLLALTRSTLVAVVVLGLFIAYHTAENYYIGPKVYGRELRLSSLAVIAAFIVGAELAGVVGALIALPLAAIYPAVESQWLADQLPEEAVEDHRRIERTEEH